ncbi:hypothetical protein GCM10027290_14180 [Micromonospora sonneratiae]
MSCLSHGARLLAAVAVTAWVLLGAVPARAADIFVEVTPSTVEAGRPVDIRASCRSNNQPATVESPAFGSVTVQPRAGFLITTARVPRDTNPDGYRVRLSCPDGGTATTRLIVVAGDRPQHGPATGFGGAAGDDFGGLLVAGGLGSTVVGLTIGLVVLRRRNRHSAPRPVRGRAGG